MSTVVRYLQLCNLPNSPAFLRRSMHKPRCPEMKAGESIYAVYVDLRTCSTADGLNQVNHLSKYNYTLFANRMSLLINTSCSLPISYCFMSLTAARTNVWSATIRLLLFDLLLS